MTIKSKSSRWCSSLPDLARARFSYNLLLISGQTSISPCNLTPCFNVSSHFGAERPWLSAFAFLGLHVCFNDLLMDDCLSSEWGFLAHWSVQPFPCLRFHSGLSPFWSSLSLFQSISSWVGPHTTSLPQHLFEFSARINVLKRKGLEEG